MIPETPFTPPSFKGEAFNCPYCQVYAKQHRGVAKQHNNSEVAGGMWLSLCYHCSNYCLWVNEKLSYPSVSTAPPPNPDLPDEIIQDYREAMLIVSSSPRGAAALLRLAIQKLCTYLREKGKNINAVIAALVNQGLPIKVQQALDIVRVVGNNAVHPG
jgi:hypothetical protein